MAHVDKVHGDNPQRVVQPRQSKAATPTTPPRTGAGHPTETVRSDRVNVSLRAKELQLAQQVVAQTPEVRADKVEAARKAVENGTHNVSAKQIAGKMVIDAFA